MASEPLVPEIAEASTRAKILTAIAMGAAGLVLVRRLPRPLRPAADLALAAGAPSMAGYLTKLGV